MMDATERFVLQKNAPVEPPMIERARRIGWGLLVVAVLAMAMGRFGPEGVQFPARIVAATAGLFGLLAVVNVALVRGLYKQVADMAQKPNDAP